MDFFENPYILLFLFGGAGLITIAAAIFDWNWVLKLYSGRAIWKVFGRNGGRLFYGFLGLILILFGVLMFIAFGGNSG